MSANQGRKIIELEREFRLLKILYFKDVFELEWERMTEKEKKHF
jgi:hypothetical protein